MIYTILHTALLEWKKYPASVSVMMIVTGWIGKHYEMVHQWLGLLLMAISILGGSASLVLVVMKIYLTYKKHF